MTPRININKVFDVIAKAGSYLEISNIARHTPLGLAACRLSLEAAIAFLRHGASTITGDTQGLTALHYAAAKAGAEGGAARLVARLVDRLLRWGVDEAAISFTGHTASCVVGFRTPVEEQVGVGSPASVRTGQISPRVAEARDTRQQRCFVSPGV